MRPAAKQLKLNSNCIVVTWGGLLVGSNSLLFSISHSSSFAWLVKSKPFVLSSFLLNRIGLFRLYSKTEQLEQLMGEEVTDINEILAVINNIQVAAQSCHTTCKSRDNFLPVISLVTQSLNFQPWSPQASQTLLSPKVVGQAQQVNQEMMKHSSKYNFQLF